MFEQRYNQEEPRKERRTNRHLKKYSQRIRHRYITSTSNDYAVPKRRTRRNGANNEPSKILKNDSIAKEFRFLLKRGVPTVDCSDPPSLKKTRKLIPEETYEHWYEFTNLNPNVQRRLNTATESKSRSSSTSPGEEDGGDDDDDDNNDTPVKADNDDDDDDDDDSDDLEEEQEEDYLYDPDEELNEVRRGRPKYLTGHYVVASSGLEVLPKIQPESMEKSTSSLSENLSYSKRHIGIVSKLLHLNVLKKNWRRAYNCFTLLIRVQSIDIRTYWPIGLEILTRLAEQDLITRAPENSIDEYKLRTYNQNDPNCQLKIIKDEQFLQWIDTFFPIVTNMNHYIHHFVLPYRISSKDTPGFYVYTLIWILLLKNKFEIVNEKISELLLKRPYINDGIFYYLQGFSFQLEASLLSQKSSHEMDIPTIETLISHASKFFTKAKDMKVEFPEDLINNEFHWIKNRISKGVDDTLRKFDPQSEPPSSSSSTISEQSDQEDSPILLKKEFANHGARLDDDLMHDSFNFDEDDIDSYSTQLHSERTRNPDSDIDDEADISEFNNDPFDDDDD